jgi:hypothetical protein
MGSYCQHNVIVSFLFGDILGWSVACATSGLIAVLISRDDHHKYDRESLEIKRVDGISAQLQ